MIALTLYAGGGGADLGMRAAGIAHAACVEVDADCCATLTAAGFPAVRAGIGGPYEVRLGKSRRLAETVPAFDPSPFVGVAWYGRRHRASRIHARESASVPPMSATVGRRRSTCSALFDRAGWWSRT